MDEKLCPLRKRAYKLGSGPGMPRSTSDEFLPCVREKCAWWNNECSIRGLSHLSEVLSTVRP
jgi:hypothetical protein